MRHGKRLIKTQSSVQIVAQRSFHNSRATNRLIAVAAIIVVILITATCSVFFNLQNFSTLQTLKSYGTTTEIIFSNPSGSSGQKSDYMRVEFSELDSSISSSKLPKDFPAMSILCAGPGTYSSSEGFCVRLGFGKSLPA